MHYLLYCVSFQEVAPLEQSSNIEKVSSENEISELRSNNLRKDTNSSICETNVVSSSSTSEHGIVEPTEIETNLERTRKKIPIGEKLSQEIEEIKVEIMPPCYGGTYNSNSLEDLETGNNTCYLSDDDRSETATLLPKNNRPRPQQTRNDNSLSEKSVHTSQDRMGQEPKDSYSFVYAVFFLLGLSTLLPWNFFISINQFWDYRFRDVNSTNLIYFVVEDNSSRTDGNQTELQKEFTSYLSIGNQNYFDQQGLE